MANFAEMQNKFDLDHTLRRKFLADPVGTLHEQGVTLTPQQAFRLQQDIEQFKRSARGGPVPELEIGVGVSINPVAVHVHISND
jgi:hypothetical protein